MARIAISYRRADSAAICRAIFDRLVQHYGSDSVFMDIDRIPIGENFHEYIGRTLQSADVLLVLVGPKWRGPRNKLPPRIHDADDPVRLELETASAAETAIVPVLVQHARMPVEGDLPESLRWFSALNAAEVDEGRDFDTHIAALIDAIDRHALGDGKRGANRRGETPNNIPHQLSTFVGRKAELKHLGTLIRNKRLVTIVGPGGVGKTRLAQQVASGALDQFPGGAWFVPVSETLNVDVAVTVASAMNLEITGRDPLQTILQHVSERPALLILDDSEQRLDAIAAFASEVLRISSFIRLLVTSRERLHVPGEQVFSLTPLELPQRDMPLDQVRRCDAVRLLLDRAKTTGEPFKITESNSADLVAICERLDGIPLALEFAAARLRTLSPHQILQRLNEQFALLVGDKNEEGRHRTLRAAIEWSHHLLDDHERLLFARLGVFHNAFDLDAVEAICADDHLPAGTILDTLTALVEKSFVFKQQSRGGPTFRLLHVIRSFALEKLDEACGRPQVEEACFSYFGALVKKFAAADAASRARAIDELVGSHADIIGALSWAIAQKREESIELALSLTSFWIVRGFFTDGAEVLEAVADSGVPDDPARALLLIRAASMRNAHGEVDAAVRNAEAGVDISESLPDRRGLADALLALGGIKANMGRYGEARELFHRATPLLEETSNDAGMAKCLVNLSLCDTGVRDYEMAREHARQAVNLCERGENVLMLSFCHGALGNAAHQSGQLAEARAEYHRSLQLARSVGYYFVMSSCLSHLAEVELLDGNLPDAERNLEESLEIVSEHNLSLQLPDAIEASARLLAEKNCDEEASKLFGNVDASRKRLKFPLLETEAEARAKVVRGIIERHSEGWFDNQHQSGESLDPATVLSLARRAIHKPRAKPREKLTLA